MLNVGIMHAMGTHMCWSLPLFFGNVVCQRVKKGMKGFGQNINTYIVIEWREEG